MANIELTFQFVEWVSDWYIHVGGGKWCSWADSDKIYIRKSKYKTTAELWDYWMENVQGT